MPLASRRGVLRAGAAAGALALGASLPASAQSVVEEDCTSGSTFRVGDGDFEVINNQWGNEAATQCIQRYDDGSYGWTFQGGGGGINYPEVYVGTRPWGSDTGVPEFPIARGNVDELTMTWDVDIDVAAGQEWNLAEEWWLLDGQPGQNPPLTHEIMLVLDWSDQHSHGADRETNVRTDRFGNQIDYWAFYPSGGTNADFHIFKINGRASAGRVDLTEIIDFLDERHGLRQDLTLTGIELGTETFDGPDGEVHVNEFDVTINGTTYSSIDGGGNGGDATAPTTPSNLSVAGTSASSVDVDWTSSTDSGGSGLAGYNVYVDGSFDHDVGAGTTSGTVSGLASETSYEVGVSAVDGAGNESSTTTVSATTDADDGDDDDGDNGDPADALVVDDYDGSPGWPGSNDLGNWTGAGSFANGGGDGEVVDGALELEYDSAGWFVEQVMQDVSEYDELVFEISGASGGEGSHFTVSLGGARGTFADLADGSIGTSISAVSIDLADAGVNQSSPGELRLNFWEGGSGSSTIAIEEIRFE